jgi:hypothetical protein
MDDAIVNPLLGEQRTGNPHPATKNTILRADQPAHLLPKLPIFRHHPNFRSTMRPAIKKAGGVS